MSSDVRKGPLTTLRASAALAAAGAWGTGETELPVYRESAVSLFVRYEEGASGGSAEVLVEVSPVGGGDDWLPAEEVLDTASAVTSGASSRVPAGYLSVLIEGADVSIHRLVEVGAAERLRVRAREVGVTATPGTLTVRGRAVAIGA